MKNETLRYYKLIIFLLIVLCTTASLCGVIYGYKSGVTAICSDVAFYYNNDLPIKGCVPIEKAQVFRTNKDGLK